MGVYILYHKEGVCPGGLGWVDACCEMVCKKLCMLECHVTSVHTTSANIGVIVVLHVHYEFKYFALQHPPPVIYISIGPTFPCWKNSDVK